MITRRQFDGGHLRDGQCNGFTLGCHQDDFLANFDACFVPQ